MSFGSNLAGHLKLQLSPEHGTLFKARDGKGPISAAHRCEIFLDRVFQTGSDNWRCRIKAYLFVLQALSLLLRHLVNLKVGAY
mmetsp:Transcript_12234/g.17033  ORF Transcript_12234/g.17033 Transcript_12234/m.17033 type:complete len:83 (-) Transcript_12234:87-335(-)